MKRARDVADRLRSPTEPAQANKQPRNVVVGDAIERSVLQERLQMHAKVQFDRFAMGS
jgi:hypothetical protein